MSVIDKLACSLGRRDEVPNQELAQQLAETEDRQEIAEIAENLWNKKAAVQADCIKVLYEIGYLKPELVAPYAADFLKLLKSRNNRLVWGAMIALSSVAVQAADELYPQVASIQKAMDAGSVITCDAGVWALANIASAKAEYNSTIFPYLLEHLRTCRPKDVPQHAERVAAAVNVENRAAFIQVIEKRMEDMAASQVTRLKRLIKQAEKKR